MIGIKKKKKAGKAKHKDPWNTMKIFTYLKGKKRCSLPIALFSGIDLDEETPPSTCPHFCHSKNSGSM